MTMVIRVRMKHEESRSIERIKEKSASRLCGRLVKAVWAGGGIFQLMKEDARQASVKRLSPVHAEPLKSEYNHHEPLIFSPFIPQVGERLMGIDRRGSIAKLPLSMERQ